MIFPISLVRKNFMGNFRIYSRFFNKVDFFQKFQVYQHFSTLRRNENIKTIPPINSPINFEKKQLRVRFGLNQ